ncbi:Meiosis induction protein kinase IME2/SME1 [Yarrowia sp. B02]|nr:Meiosis induction protein kinase IME2/SME1 [Yarrowia sp. B02]
MADPMLLTVKSLDDRYVLLKNIGKGSFGHVSLARVRSKAAAENDDMRAGSMVAIKTMKKKLASVSEYNFLREVEFIREVRPHRFLVNVHDMFVDSVNHHFHMSMEVMEMNLYNLMKTQEKVPFAPHAVRSMLWQIVCGIDHIHRHHFFHRDIKPENILVSRYTPYHNENSTGAAQTQFRIKIADFGLSRHIDDRDPYTAYVSTRWYRAPEILLRCEYYSGPVDIWAFGAMAAEVANLKPLFPGSNELDQFNLQVALLGTPGQHSLGGKWARAPELCAKLNINLAPAYGKSSNAIMAHPEHAGLTDVVLMCLTWDPEARCSARDIMYHRYFAQESSIEVPRTLKRSPLRITKQAREVDANARVPSFAASLKQTQGLNMNKGVNMSQAGAAAAMSRDRSGSNVSHVPSVPGSFLASTAPAKKKFGHWTNIFKRDDGELNKENVGGQNVGGQNVGQTNVGQTNVSHVSPSPSYVPKIPLPQLPPLESIAASIDSLSIEARSTNTTLTERMSGAVSGGTSQSEWSETNESLSDERAKGSTGGAANVAEALMKLQETPTRVSGVHKALPDTPDSASSMLQMPPPPLPLPKQRKREGKVLPAGVRAPFDSAGAASPFGSPVESQASSQFQHFDGQHSAQPEDHLEHFDPHQNSQLRAVETQFDPLAFSNCGSDGISNCIKPPSPASSHYEPPACLDEHSDSQLTAYERSVRDSVLMMGVRVPPESPDSCTSLEEASESPSVNDSPLVDQFGGSSADIRIETGAFLTPDLDKGSVWVRADEVDCPVYSRLQTNSFRDRKVGAMSSNIEVD